MEIRINNETVDFTLEHEKVLGEVVDGVQEWLAVNGFMLTAVRRDTADLKLGDRLEWQDDPVDEISSLEITALHPTDLAIDKLTAIIQYLELIVEDGNAHSPVIADLLKGIDDVSQMIDGAVLSETNGGATFGSQFKTLADATGITTGEVHTDNFQEFLRYVSELVIVLRSRLRELSDPLAELKSSVPLLREALDNTGEISVFLQTGDDREALGRLVRFLEISQKMLRLIHRLNEHAILDLGGLDIEGAAISEFTGELNGYLIELSKAIEAGDTVLTGDLLEYEIGPRLAALLKTLEKSGVL